MKNPITYLKKPVFQMDDEELHELLDVNWYPAANNKLDEQRRIWDYSYIAYKGIMLHNEINYSRRKNGYGLYVNVPRTFATIEGIRKNFNINQLKIDIEKGDNMKPEEYVDIFKVKSFLNYDLERSGTREQIKAAGFDKLLFGNGFLYSFLMNRSGKFGKITGEVDKKTGRVKASLSEKEDNRYYGMVARRISPYGVLPDPDGSHLDVDNVVDRMCNYVCLRSVKHIANFRRDWRGIIPEEILKEVKPGGKDMNNYEAVRETIDMMFDANNIGNNATLKFFVENNKVSKSYDSKEYVEERIWLGEDFLIVQAGAGLKICLVSPNPNPEKRYALEKLDDVSIPGEFWSMGEPYLMRYQQVEENRIHNSVLDLIHFSVSGMLGINTQYLEDPYDLDVFPGKVWKFKAIPGVNIGDVMTNFQASPAAIAPALKFMQEIKAIGQQTTSITDFVTGSSKALTGTATEANKLAGASDLTIVDKIREMVSGAMVNICQNWLAQYPIAYAGEKIKKAGSGQKIYFTGKNRALLSEKEIMAILEDGYETEDIVSLDDLDVSNPRIKVVGDIEISKEAKFNQFVTAVNFSNNINKVAFETGDSRRIDVVKMGQEALAMFDVISDPKSFIMEEQPTKSDLVQDTAMAGAMANTVQQRGGGRPANTETPMPISEETAMRSDAQPRKL